MIEALKERMEELSYPDNHGFDVETMKPVGVLAERIQRLRNNAPGMFEPAESFLDIGSNKGYISFLASEAFEKVVGYEPATEIYEFAEDLRQHNGIENIRFINKGFRSITNKKFDVVYIGNVHHYLFRDDVRARRPYFSFLKKLKNVTKHLLVMDGAFEGTDFAIQGLAVDEGWKKRTTDRYTLKAFKDKLAPEFTLIGYEYNGIGEDHSSRYTAVFQRGV